MSIVNSLRTYFRTCPSIMLTREFGVDNISNELSYSITIVPSVRTIDEDIIGTKTQQRQFLLLVRAKTAYAQHYIANQELLENLEGWLEEQNDNRNFPDIPAGLEPIEIQAVNAGYLSEQEESGSTAVYQITCNLIYKKGAQ